MILRPHFDAGRPRAREGGRAAGAGRGARHAVRHHLRRPLGGRLSRSAARPLDPRRRGEHRRDRASTISHAWRTERYRAGSLYLVAAGKVDHDALVALAEARFADLPAGRDRAAPSRRASPAASASAGGRADQAHLASRLCRRRPQLDPDYYAARLFADMVGGGASSRLFQAVREERGLAYSVWASLLPYRDGGLFHFYAATARREAAAAAALIAEVVAEARRDRHPARARPGARPRPRRAC